MVLPPLILGYLVPVRSGRPLARINRSVDLSVYAILGLMGVSLTGLDDLGGQLARMGGQAGVVVLGVIAGLLLGRLGWETLPALAERTLSVLLALIGCQLRNSGISGIPLTQILLNRHGLAIATTVAVSSLVAGLIAAPLLGLRWNVGLAMAAGFGWYSLPV